MVLAQKSVSLSFLNKILQLPQTTNINITIQQIKSLVSFKKQHIQCKFELSKLDMELTKINSLLNNSLVDILKQRIKNENESLKLIQKSLYQKKEQIETKIFPNHQFQDGQTGCFQLKQKHLKLVGNDQIPCQNIVFLPQTGQSKSQKQKFKNDKSIHANNQNPVYQNYQLN